jgi:hypothetical protein
MSRTIEATAGRRRLMQVVPFGDDLIDRRLGEAGRHALAATISLAEFMVASAFPAIHVL